MKLNGTLRIAVIAIVAIALAKLVLGMIPPLAGVKSFL